MGPFQQDREACKMKGRMGRQGSISTVLLLLIFGAVVFVGISFGRPYIRYNTLRSHTKDILSSEIGALPAIKEKIMADAAELKVPLKEENLELTMVNKIIKVKATWSETVNFWDYYQKQLDFVMEVEY
jgi:hypothetical protein